MFKELSSALRPAVVLTLLLTLLLGGAYPLVMTGFGQVLFSEQANGSPIRQDGKIVGSRLIGQSFTNPRYFHGRPSAAGKGYDPTASSGSNLGPTSKALVDRINTDIAALPKSPGTNVPPDLVTASASGLDPHISPEAALFQVASVAQARGLPAEQVRVLVDRQTEHPLLGFLGEPRVNVLELNLALDRAQTKAQ